LLPVLLKHLLAAVAAVLSKVLAVVAPVDEVARLVLVVVMGQVITSATMAQPTQVQVAVGVTQAQVLTMAVQV
jgi:hypothetical protein